MTTYGIMYNILGGQDGHTESVHKDLVWWHYLSSVSSPSKNGWKLPVHYVPFLLFIVVKTQFFIQKSLIVK